MNYDPRITAARADLAAEPLRGRIDAPRYAPGRAMRVAVPTADVRKGPVADAGLDTQLLFGETFTVYEDAGGWSWGQAALDSYVGYVRSGDLVPAALKSTHRVHALATPLLTGPGAKHAARAVLPLNAKLTIIQRNENFAKTSDGLFVFAGHIAPLKERAADWVAVAERFLGVPYLWGGKTAGGLDCSGLIQTTLEAAGTLAPRDTDMMEAWLGQPVATGSDLSGLGRGDLIFWKGHVGVMQDSARLLHANAHFMEVTSEKLAGAAARIAPTEGPIRAVRRL